MKKVLCLMVAVLVMTFGITAMAAEKGKIVVSVEGEAKTGQTITVKTEIAVNPGIYAMQVKPAYDSNVLELTNITDDMGNVWMIQDKTKDPTFYDISEKYAEYTGKMLTFTYRVLDTASLGTSSVSISIVAASNFNEEVLDIDVVAANFEVKCEHVSDGGKVTKEAGCTEDGTMTFSCTKCKAVIKTEPILKTDHSWDEGIVTVKASCKEKGSRLFTCKNNPTHTKTEDILPLDHTPGAAVKENEVAASCDQAGSYDEVVYCTECNAEISRNTVNVSAPGHAWDEGSVVTEAEIGKEGLMRYTCKNNPSHIREEKISALADPSASEASSEEPAQESKEDSASEAASAPAVASVPAVASSETSGTASAASPEKAAPSMGDPAAVALWAAVFLGAAGGSICLWKRKK